MTSWCRWRRGRTCTAIRCSTTWTRSTSCRPGRGTLADGEAVPWNTFWFARELLGPTTEFVSPNNDTLYLIAPLDLSGGPVRLDVPDTHDRYYVLQCVDAWTNNFAYIGRRATGTAAGSFTFVPPGFTGSVDDGSTVVHAPSTVR